ncbi:hypothetical protein ANCCAN_26377 [Ancylostoma caninum]|uniref:Uncharacterized protein n=1 Tax=Ancylostoma caninum TaxID=29170 RepID=A0A368FCI6_ANCCA|nr:hypothetical protein ANCCAN_26377 [Ancylostoma caninum]
MALCWRVIHALLHPQTKRKGSYREPVSVHSQSNLSKVHADGCRSPHESHT